MCFSPTSSLLAAGSAYGVAAWLLRRDHPRLKWSAVALMGVTSMQLVEGLLWLDGPRPHGTINQLLTIALIPIALLAQAWGPLFGSLYVKPIKGRTTPFYSLLIIALVMVVGARISYEPKFTQVTPDGHLNWFSQTNPPVFAAWSYGLWAFVIGLPFLLWWRPFWQSLVVVTWGWAWAVIAWLVSDSAASYWCFFVTFYAAFVLIYSFMVDDDPSPNSCDEPICRSASS